MKEEYMIVLNKNSPVPLRHVIKMTNYMGEEEFKDWYYDTYFKLDGDEFIYCDSHKSMIEFLERLYNHEENKL